MNINSKNTEKHNNNSENLRNKSKNNQICVKIQSLNINGEGISSFENKKVCVSGVLPGEEVMCNVQVDKPTFLGCKLEKIISSSENRKETKCIYSGVCGGCNFDYVNYNDATEIKRKTLKNYFSNIFDGQVDVERCENNYGYRNKISFCVENNTIGLKKSGSSILVEVNKCLLADAEINKIVPSLKKIVKSLNSLNLKHIVIRKLSDSLILTFVFNKYITRKIDALKKTCQELKDAFELKIGVYANINKRDYQILGDEWYHIFGEKNQTVKLQELKFQIHPYSFLQVNDEIRNKIYNFVLKEVENQTVIEGYSGAGIMSCMLAQKAREVFSVEINKESYLNAEQAKNENKISNLININSSCHKVLPELVKKYPNSIFLIDPPRSGCDVQTLHSLKQSKIKKVIYISCNPYTLKQNLVFLNEEYKIESLTMFDMFPNTFHMETVAILKRRDL